MSNDGQAFAGGPPRGWQAMTRSDTTNEARVVRNLYVGANGNVKVTTQNDDVVTFPNVPAGSYVVGYFKRVWNTGTTVSGGTTILGGYDTVPS